MNIFQYHAMWLMGHGSPGDATRPSRDVRAGIMLLLFGSRGHGPVTEPNLSSSFVTLWTLCRT